ncbi:MAG: site-2 protease family protein [Candidatus Micrarchaeia archaeon]
MAGDVPIGRLFGIEISLHWTFILLVLFVLLISLYLSLLIILLFICVLVHELAHSITSIRNGIKVKKIMLLPIGGASIIDSVDINPKVEFNIAIVGPIMSLFLGGISGIAVIFSPPGIITQVLQFLFEINILLGVFNLLPVFPMDGGRVFRSYLQKRHNFFDATMITIKASEYIMAAIVIGTVGFALFATGYSVSYREFMSIWDLIIVMFLYGGVQAEKENAIIKRDTKGLYVGDAKSRSFVFVSPDRKISYLYKMLKKYGEHIMVTKIGNDFAIVDIFKKEKMKDAVYVRDIARIIPKVSAKAGVADALSRMESTESGIMAVVQNGRLAGIVTSSQLQAFITLHLASMYERRGYKTSKS